METIYLAGYHGVGKSMVGKLIASRKELKYIDTDSLIEEKENKSIEEIVNLKGIDYYNNLGKYILKNSIEQGMIVSISSDIPKDEENRKLIKTSGRVIYLRAKAETICENLKTDYAQRPELKNNFSVFTVEKNMNEMKPYYEELANYIIDVDNKKISTVFREALAIYNYANKVKCHIYIK
ncbi:MAG: shikimate kinase [Lachnospiraceae bacterium]|nr:shikimate kinase [Lachnospiraceae bacterium]